MRGGTADSRSFLRAYANTSSVLSGSMTKSCIYDPRRRPIQRRTMLLGDETPKVPTCEGYVSQVKTDFGLEWIIRGSARQCGAIHKTTIPSVSDVSDSAQTRRRVRRRL